MKRMNWSPTIPDWALPGLQEALLRTEAAESLNDVLGLVDAKEAQVWATDEACIITRLVMFQDGRKPEVHIFLATGELNACLELADYIEGWAKMAHFGGMTLIGRMGWERVLKNRGWERIPATFMIKRF
jgi:hypothetical protein